MLRSQIISLVNAAIGRTDRTETGSMLDLAFEELLQRQPEASKRIHYVSGLKGSSTLEVPDFISLIRVSYYNGTYTDIRIAPQVPQLTYSGYPAECSYCNKVLTLDRPLGQDTSFRLEGYMRLEFEDENPIPGTDEVLFCKTTARMFRLLNVQDSAALWDNMGEVALRRFLVADRMSVIKPKTEVKHARWDVVE